MATFAQSVTKMLKIRGAKSADDLLKKTKGKRTITFDKIDDNMDQREYEINNKKVLEYFDFIQKLSKDEQIENNLFLGGDFPENTLFHIQCSHDTEGHVWKDIYRGGTQKFPFLMDPPPPGYTSIHRRFLQIMQDSLMNPSILHRYAATVLQITNNEPINWINLDTVDRCKIINSFWFINFGTDEIPDFFIEPSSDDEDYEDVMKTIKTYKQEKKMYCFNKTHKGQYIKWQSFDLQMYQLDAKPESFTSIHNEMMKKFLKSFVYVSTMHKDSTKSLLMRIESILKIIKSNYEKMDSINFEKMSEPIKKVYVEIHEVESDYISILSMSKNTLTFLVRKWSAYMWNVSPEKESDKKDIPEAYMYIPQINGNNINWVKVRVQTINKK